jgi:senataxin
LAELHSSAACTDALNALRQEAAETLTRLEPLELAVWPCRRRHQQLQTVSSLADAAALSIRNELSASDAYTMVESANIVFSTLCSAGQALVRNMTKPDMLIVDEAAQALESELLIAVSCQPRSLVLIGDPLQLPATSRSSAPAVAKVSAMERLMHVPAQACALLDTQYRMHSEICSFPARHFYKAALRSAEGLDLRTSPVAAADWPPYMFVDMAQGYEHVLPTKSIQNAVEANAIVRLALHLRDQLGVRLELHVVVVTFYAAQQKRIRASAAAAAVSELAVHTVDSFQGSEAPIVLCSCVRSNRQGRVGFLADPRRLNVALTRAMHSLVIVGNLSTLEASDSPDLRAMAKDAVERGRVAALSEITRESGGSTVRC